MSNEEIMRLMKAGLVHANYVLTTSDSPTVREIARGDIEAFTKAIRELEAEVPGV